MIDPDPTPRARLLYAVVWLTVASSFVVMFEPAPCDALFAVAVGIAAVSAPRLLFPAADFGVYGPLYAFVLANFISLVLVDNVGDSLRYFGITIYMVASLLFFAGLVARDGPWASDFLLRALCVAAAGAAAVGILARFQLIPQAELFFRDETGLRVKSTFKDPNVFAPFLVAAFLATLSRVTSSRRMSWIGAAMLILYAVGITMAFSRGAYVHLGASLLVFAGLHVLVLRQPRALRRLGGLAVFLGFIGFPVLVLTLAATDLSGFFLERLGLQAYDTDGRFANQLVALTTAVENPLGIGPGVYGTQAGQIAVHNLYVRVLVENGILGFFGMMIFLVVWLHRCLVGVLARGGSADTYACCLAIVIGALMESLIIDTLHWRHLFLILAIPVGLSLHERSRAWLPDTSSRPVGSPRVLSPQS